MKNYNKIRFLSASVGIALVVCQMLGNTAAADYRGYWADAVRNYQDMPQAGAYQENNYPAYPQQANYVEPAYQPAPQPYVDRAYMPAPMPVMQAAGMSGKASYYADQYNGLPTASGEVYDMNAMTAAHPNLPFGTPIRVTNLENGRSVVVRVNDRGPHKPGRIVDVSKAAAEQLGLILNGSANVQVEVVG